LALTAQVGGGAMPYSIKWLIGVAVLQACVLALLAWLLPGFTVGGVGSVLFAALLFTVAGAAAWPFIYRLSSRVHPLLFPVLSFALTGVLIVLLTDLVTDLFDKGLHVDGVGTGILVAFGLTVGSTLLSAFFSLRDDDAYDWFVTRPLRREYAGATRSADPGILFLEIDGLAEPILRQSIAEGWMPTLRRWLELGSHRITMWEPDLSSQTSASQAGILLGDNTGIPAFRWYDKDAGALRVSSRMATARELEGRLSHGVGLLKGGASRWNVFSGDAPDTLCTYSTFGVRGRRGSGRYMAYFANPYTLPRSVALFFGDVIRERWQAWRQVRRDERPRIHRPFQYAAIRAATTTLMQEAGLFMLIADSYRGVPAVYSTFFAYDEVAHHSGIDRADAFKVLGTLDRVIATLECAIATAPRPYHLVVLSDHGQSMGATFRQRFGQTLGELVTSLVEPQSRVTADQRAVEDWGNVGLALSEGLLAGADRRTVRLLKRALHRRTVDGTVSLGPAGEDRDASLERSATDSDVVVLASGNLGLVSFPRWGERLTYEQIVDRFPALIPGLVGHEGIGFVLVRSETEGGLVIGAQGIYYLDHEYADGVDPLAVYGPNAAHHLRRTDGFANAPDVLVMSSFDPTTGEVAAFEELVGSHGGLGGPQTQPFLLHPTALDPGSEPIVGAGALHRVLKNWVANAQEQKA
jgi:uncharacterized membrane protein YvlD (DUF360 family)